MLKVSSGEQEKKPLISVVMGSDSDLETLRPGIMILEEFEIEIEVKILSAHRTPLEMIKFAQEAKSKGIKIIIAGAGGAAHLPGMIASLTNLPVVGVPVKTKALSGVDSMYSILQMPAGVPVATVAIGGGLNAGLLAAQILGVSNHLIQQKLDDYRKKLHNSIVKKDETLNNIGSKKYTEQM